MVLPRRHHNSARPTRRRQGYLFICAAISVLVYLAYFRRSPYSLHPSFRSSSSSDSWAPISQQTAVSKAELFLGNPPKWRDPNRDFEAEYEEVVKAMPALRSSRPARIAFLVMAHGPTDVKMLKRSLPWLYSPHNFILVSAGKYLLF